MSTVGEIGCADARCPAAGVDLCSGLFERVGAAADQAERAPGRAEPQRELAPDPTAGAGDKDSAVGDFMSTPPEQWRPE